MKTLEFFRVFFFGHMEQSLGGFVRYFYMSLFGLVGIFLRYEIGIWATRNLPLEFPFATFIINLVGSFLIGVLYVLTFEHATVSIDVRTGIMVGLLGGFTTFSSFSLETVRLMEMQRFGLGLGYLVLCPILCVSFSYVGLALTRVLMRI